VKGNETTDSLAALLGKRADYPSVRELIEREPDQIHRSAYQGYVEFKDYGVSMVFKEAPWVVRKAEIKDPGALHLAAFHLHRNTHEGHNGYKGQLPGGVVFDDSEHDVIRKLGQPGVTGGGGFSPVLRKPIPRWLQYSHGGGILHFQLDGDGKVEMVTLYVPDQQISEAGKRE
jgi:hypothetical protein